MALYKTHTKFNLILALPTFVILSKMYIHPSNNQMILFAFSFVYATLFLNPDLDLAHQIKLFSFRGLLTLPFRFYSMLFKHRGVSHSLFLGTLSRVLYLIALLIVAGFLTNKILFIKTHFFDFFKNHQMIFFSVFAGFFLADVSHLFLDFFSTKK